MPCALGGPARSRVTLPATLRREHTSVEAARVTEKARERSPGISDKETIRKRRDCKKQTRSSGKGKKRRDRIGRKVGRLERQEGRKNRRGKTRKKDAKQEGMSEAQKEEKTASVSVNFMGIHDTVLKTLCFAMCALL